MDPLISLIIPVYNEELYIENCIKSILGQDYPNDQIEVIFVDGMSNDNTHKIINNYAKKYSTIRLYDNFKKVVPYALNIGIKQSRGEIIIRLDAHSVYPQNYVSDLVRYLYELNADNVGGLWNTIPANNTIKCLAIALASSHKFGVGNSKHKVGSDKIIETDTVPYGCYKKNIFDKIGFFDEELIRNQDDEFNARLKKNGGKIFLIPSIKIGYIARDSFKKMIKMYYQYGLFKPLVNKKIGKPATWRQFFPMLFIAGLVVGLIMGFFSKVIFYLYFVILLIYIFLSFFFAAKIAIKEKRIVLFFVMPFVFFMIHTSYGIGYWKGILNIILKKTFNIKSNK